MSLIRTYESIYNPGAPTSLELFEESKRRLSAKKQEIADCQNEYNLLEQQAFDLYKSHVEYMMLGKNLITAAQDWLAMKEKGVDADGNKLDKRKKYTEKSHYEFLTEYLGKLFEVQNIKITEIIQYGYWAEGYSIIFMYADKKWSLFVPLVNAVTMKSFQSNGEYCFTLKVYEYLEEHHMRCIKSTFKEEDLKGILGGEKNEKDMCGKPDND